MKALRGDVRFVYLSSLGPEGRLLISKMRRNKAKFEERTVRAGNY